LALSLPVFTSEVSQPFTLGPLLAGLYL
jgi:hypothetical protein